MSGWQFWLLCETKKRELFDLTLTWSNRKKNSQETQIYTLFLQKSFAKIAINEINKEKTDQFWAKENSSIKLQSVHAFLICTVNDKNYWWM